MERFLSAPGKLFLAGEYAVLWGGTARIAAVGPRAFAHVKRRQDREVHLILADGRLVGQSTPLGIRWARTVPREFEFAARCLGDVFRTHGKEALGLSLALSPSAAVEGRKLGIGGSARACLLTAEAARYVLEERFDSLKLALLSHGIQQNLRGSGGDVAAIFAGGLVRYRRYAADALAPEFNSSRAHSTLSAAPPVDLWRLPLRTVWLSYAFSGTSVSTPSLIAHVEERLSDGKREKFVETSDALGQTLEDALARMEFEGVQQTVPELQRLLAGLGALETEPMRRILSLAKSFQSVGKMSGAGGGDGCVLFSPDPAARNQLLDGLRARGFFALPLELEPGLRGEPAVDASIRGWVASESALSTP